MFPKEIICSDPLMIKEAQKCSQFLSIPIHDIATEEQYLKFAHFSIDLITLKNKQSLSYCHNFEAPAIQRRLQTQEQHLLKAFNDKQKAISRILDVTAGWCRDSFILAHNNFRVSAVEQSDLIYYLSQFSLSHYLTRHQLSLKLHHANAMDYLKNLNDLPDAIYLDPMFPSAKNRAKNRAKNKKELQLLQEITQNVAMDKLFELSLNKARQRVVVKRPLHGEFLNNLKPNFQFKAKAIRFDIYQCVF